MRCFQLDYLPELLYLGLKEGEGGTGEGEVGEWGGNTQLLLVLFVQESCLLVSGEVNVHFSHLIQMQLSLIQLFDGCDTSGLFVVEVIAKMCHYLAESVSPLDQLIDQAIQCVRDSRGDAIEMRNCVVRDNFWDIFLNIFLDIFLNIFLDIFLNIFLNICCHCFTLNSLC